MDYLEDGKTVFRLRLRLCSSLFPVNERIRDFFVEYDRHTLHTSPPWGSELLEVTIRICLTYGGAVDFFLLWLTQNVEILLLWLADAFIFSTYHFRRNVVLRWLWNLLCNLFSSKKLLVVLLLHEFSCYLYFAVATGAIFSWSWDAIFVGHK